jgi:hypothetical protein
MESSAVSNEEQACDWKGDKSAHWLVHEERFERMLAPFADDVLTSAARSAPESVARSSEVSPGGIDPPFRSGRAQEVLGRRHRPRLDLTSHGRTAGPNRRTR